MPAGVGTIAVVRGQLDDERAEEILGFLSRKGGLNDEAARRRLSEAVCVALDGGEIVGVNSVHPAGVQLIGGRRFWIYRSVLARNSDELWSRMFNTAFETLAEEFDQPNPDCIGVCAMVGDQDRMSRRPEVVWPDDELMLAGWLDDGRQVRIRYFWDAAIAPGLPNSPPLDVTRHQQYPLEDRYRICPLSDGGTVTTDDVLELWAREGALRDQGDQEEAHRRVREVQLVATDGEEVAGVSSVFLLHNPQLRMDLWHYRTYVARAHRKSNLAAQLIFGNRDLMEERFIKGEDTRGAGMIFELENEGVKQYFNKALWLPADFTFIGENERGDHVRVHYFPGGRVPVLRPAPTG
jgi:hypothetical protein